MLNAGLHRQRDQRVRGALSAHVHRHPDVAERQRVARPLEDGQLEVLVVERGRHRRAELAALVDELEDVGGAEMDVIEHDEVLEAAHGRADSRVAQGLEQPVAQRRQHCDPPVRLVPGRRRRALADDRVRRIHALERPREKPEQPRRLVRAPILVHGHMDLAPAEERRERRQLGHKGRQDRLGLREDRADEDGRVRSCERGVARLMGGGQRALRVWILGDLANVVEDLREAVAASPGLYDPDRQRERRPCPDRSPRRRPP